VVDVIISFDIAGIAVVHHNVYVDVGYSVVGVAVGVR